MAVGSGLTTGDWSLPEHLSHRVVNQTIARNDLRRVDVQGRTTEIGNSSSGLLNQQNAGSEIPRRAIELGRSRKEGGGDPAEAARLLRTIR